MKGKTFWVLVLALLAGGGVLGWQSYQARLNALPPGFAAGNGRVESVQVDVTTKEPGRVETILVHEGNMVKAGQVVAKMDTVTLGAELAQAQADVAQEEAKGLEVAADISQAESLLKLAEVELVQNHNLLTRKATSRKITTSRRPRPRPAVLRSTARKPGSTRPGNRSTQPRPRRQRSSRGSTI